MIYPKNDYYLCVCVDCEWFEHCDKAPFKAQRKAREHALRNVTHHGVAVNVTRLDVIATYQFEPLTRAHDEPTF